MTIHSILNYIDLKNKITRELHHWIFSAFRLFSPASYESAIILHNVKFINCLIASCLPGIITYDNENICAFMSMQHYIDNIFFRTLRSLFNLFAKLYPKILHVNIIRLSNRIYSMNAFKWKHIRNIIQIDSRFFFNSNSNKDIRFF